MENFKFLSIHENFGRPTQIVQFKDSEDPDKDYDVLINQKILDEVLATCGNFPLSVISIIGPARTGKSFLANKLKDSLIRMLSTEENTIENYCTNAEFTISHGYDPETRGVWIWSKSFHVQGENGKTAVLLLDNQGFHDELPPEQFNIIFGLSFLCSSNLILNVCNDAEEFPFEMFSSYKKFTEACTSSKSSHFPIPKISILVRDWYQTNQFALGSKGGAKYLQEHKDIGSLLAQVSEDASCCLLPHIGEKALTDTFSGKLDDTEEEFQKHFQSYITGIIGFMKLKSKQILGNEVTAKELKELIPEYLDALQSDSSLGTDVLLLEKTETAFMKMKIQKGLSSYKLVFDEKIKQSSHGYLQDNKLKALDVKGREKARKSFKCLNVFHDHGSKLGLERLIKEIDNEFRNISKQNKDKKQSLISQYTATVTEGFRAQLEKKFALSPPDESKSIIFFEDDDIQKACVKLIKESESDFIQCFPEGECQLTSMTSTLAKVLETISENFLARNVANREAASTLVREVVQRLKKQYEDFIKELLHRVPDIQASMLTYLHDKEMGGIEKDFRADCPTEVIPFVNHWWNNLSEAINMEYKKTLNALPSTMQEAIKLVSETSTAYRNLLLEKVNVFCEQEISNFHNKKLEEFIKAFKNSNPFPPNTSNFDIISDRLRSSLGKIYVETVQQEMIARQKLSTKLTEVIEHALLAYKTPMQKLFANDRFCDEDEFDMQHVTSRDAAVNKFTSQVSSMQLQNQTIENANADLLTEIEACKLQFESTNSSHKSIAVTTAEEQMDHCMTSFEEQLNEAVKDMPDETNLEEIYTNVKMEMFIKFRSNFYASQSNFCDDYIARLNEKADKIYQTIQSFYTMKHDADDSEWCAILAEVSKTYHDEMNQGFKDKRVPFTGTDLKKLHDRSTCFALRHPTRPLTDQETSKLETLLDTTFVKYMDQNEAISKSFTDPVLGIDLGTTYTCVAVYHDGRIDILRNGLGENTTPSYVAIDPDGSAIIGQTAKSTAHQRPEATIYDAKRIIGRKMDDPNLQNDIKVWPFTIVEEEGVPKIKVHDKTYFPESISAMLLKHIKKEAEEYLKKPVTKAVITVPAYFKDGQRQATRDAGEIAGFNVLNILNEPTAAALAYRLKEFHGESTKNVLVYDLGGGTFDVAVLKMNDDMIEVLSVNGDSHLGGEDFDRNAMEYCAQHFKTNSGVDLLQMKTSLVDLESGTAKRTLRRLQSNCEIAKKHLTNARAATIAIDAFYNGQDFNVDLRKREFEDCNKALFERTIEIVKQALVTANINKEDIDDIILVGGSTRIPMLQKMLSDFFGKQLNKSLNGDEAVAYGAAIQAAMLNAKPGTKPFDFDFIQDVTPMSYGIELANKELDVLVPKNTKFPHKIAQEYKTANHNQTTITVRVFQGDKPIAAENELIGEFVLEDIPPGPAQKEIFDVTMTIDQDGILHVEAVCRSNQKGKSITVTENKGRISGDQKTRLLS